MRGIKGTPNVHYTYDRWVDEEGYLFIRVEAIEYERATVENFRLTARRCAQRAMLAEGLELPRITNNDPLVEEWDVALDYATDLPIAKVFRTRRPVMHEVLQGA